METIKFNFQCRPREVVVFLTTNLENDNRAKFWIIFPDTFHNFQNVLFIVLIVLDLFTRQGIISYFNMFLKLLQLFNLKKILKRVNSRYCVITSVDLYKDTTPSPPKINYKTNYYYTCISRGVFLEAVLIFQK